ncbi:hypothetical protein ACFL60_06030 [Candidatus Omnitrophota bacterium]
MKFDNDLVQFEWMKNNLFSAVVCDAFDQLGIYDRAMCCRIRPFHHEFVIKGRTRTVL